MATTTTTPTVQKALFLLVERGPLTLGTKPIPTPGPGDLLIKLQSTALNPVDWMIKDNLAPLINSYPAVIGMDSAGIVEGVGEEVVGFEKGDRVSVSLLFPNIIMGSLTFARVQLCTASIRAILLIRTR